MSPTEDHEIPIEAMRHRPAAVAQLARTLFGLEVPDGRVRPASETATDAKFKIKDWRKDSVYLVGEDPVRLGLVLEVQRKWDEEKLYSWPVYHAVTRARHHCEAAVVVLCETEALAKRYARPIKTGPGNQYRPLVATLGDLAPVTDSEIANRYPEFATLAMLGDAPPPNARPPRASGSRRWTASPTRTPGRFTITTWSTASHRGCGTIWRT